MSRLLAQLSRSVNITVLFATTMEEDCGYDSSFSASSSLRLFCFSIQWTNFAVGLWQGLNTTIMLFVDPYTTVHIHNLERAWQTFQVEVRRHKQRHSLVRRVSPKWMGMLAQTPHSVSKITSENTSMNVNDLKYVS